MIFVKFRALDFRKFD